MSLGDFFDNIGLTDLIDNIKDKGEDVAFFIGDKVDAVTITAEELVSITGELKDDIVDACINEGVDALKQLPEAVWEAKDLAAPLITPNAYNFAKASYRIKKVSED